MSDTSAAGGPTDEPQPRPYAQTTKEFVTTLTTSGKTYEEIVAELKQRGIKLGGMKS